MKEYSGTSDINGNRKWRFLTKMSTQCTVTMLVWKVLGIRFRAEEIEEQPQMGSQIESPSFDYAWVSRKVDS